MEFAWNTQKNKMNDVKGKEMEQDRKGRKSNPDIDDTRTNMNYDLVENDKTLYQRVKERVDEVRSVSRIQKNSVVDFSNIITVPKEQYEEWRMITACPMKPPVMMEWIPSGIILGLRMGVKEENLVVSMAREAGIKDIYKSIIDSKNRLNAVPVTLK